MIDKIYPTFEADGKIEEIHGEISGLGKWPELKLIKQKGFTIDFNQLQINIHDTVKFDVYIRHEFLFKLADRKRSAHLFLYVHMDYLKGDPEREKKIEMKMNDVGPWLFTYADRGTWI